MIDTEQLLQPLAGADPSGADPEADSRFDAVRSAIEAGSEESPPEWKKLRQQILDLLNDGRSLDLLVYLAVTLTATDGYRGLRDGLLVLARSVEDFWDSIHPKLDETEPEDERYDIRLNTLAQLGEAPRKLGDPLGFVEKILRAPLHPSNRSPHVFWPVWEAEQGGGNAADAATVRDAFLRLDSSDREALLGHVKEALEALKHLNRVLIEKTGTSFNAPFEEHLQPALEFILKFMEAADGGGASAPAEETTPSAGAAPASAPAAAAVPVAQAGIRSSSDVRNALDKIIEYYRKAEPSSPVPFLLIRAKKLIDADFLTIVGNLHKDSEFQFRTTLDITDDNE